MTEDDLKALSKILGYRFRDKGLLQEALSHPSLGGKINYQRLEFLGDRVLGLVIAELLYARFKLVKEGVLARRLADLVRRETLVIVATGLGLHNHILMAKGTEDDGGRQKPAIIADSCEAVIGAIYLDGGLDAARSFIARVWEPLLADKSRGERDSKSALQEWAQAAGLPTPHYRLVGRDGPDHAPVFTIEVSVNGQAPVEASGSSKRIAETAAADIMLKKVRK